MKAISIRFMIYGAILTPFIQPLNDILVDNFTLILAVALLVLLDTALGVVIALSLKKATSNTFWVKFFSKVVSYLVLLLLCIILYWITQTNAHFYVEPELAGHIVIYPLAFMLIRELWSIVENIEVLQPGLTAKIRQWLPAKFRQNEDK